MNEKEKIFDKTKNDKYYMSLKEQTPIVGVWDDHDFGMDNAGKDYANKNEAKTMFLNFLDEPMNTERRLSHDGTYIDYYVTSEDIKIHILLLDVRFNMIHDVDVLGDKQWQWVENKVKTSDADVFLVGSGI